MTNNLELTYILRALSKSFSLMGSQWSKRYQYFPKNKELFVGITSVCVHVPSVCAHMPSACAHGSCIESTQLSSHFTDWRLGKEIMCLKSQHHEKINLKTTTMTNSVWQLGTVPSFENYLK